jgi:general stress protein 26
MGRHGDIERVWDIVEKVGVGMLTTQFAGGLRARPLEARADRRAGLIRFVADRRGAKDDEIASAHEVCFVVLDPEDKAYLSIAGRAEVRRDPGMAAEIWKSTDDAWWPDGPHDPNVRLIVLTPSLAELWDGPASAAVAAFEFAKARITGNKPDLGENRKSIIAMD